MRKFLPLAFAAALVLSAVATVVPAVYAFVPVTQSAACGATLTANTIITPPIFHCALPVDVTIGAPNIVVECKGVLTAGVGAGIGIDNPGYTGVSIIGCTLKGYTTGIEINTATSNNLLGDTAENSIGDGFYIVNSVSTTLTKDRALSNGADGFDLRGSSYSLLLGNTAKSNTGSGFYFSGDSYDTISSNTATADVINGFILTGSIDSILTGNKASGTTASNDGFLFTGSSNGNSLISSTSVLNGHDGIQVTSSNNIFLNSNGVKANGHDGIELDTSSATILLSNKAPANGNDGIQLVSSNNNYLYANSASCAASSTGTATCNLHDGIELDGSNSNWLVSNTASSNHNDGIHLDAASGTSGFNFMSGNTESYNAHYDREDDSTGSGTDGTSNIWIGDISATNLTFPALLP
jgi:parallel beta-helix repeat protein